MTTKARNSVTMAKNTAGEIPKGYQNAAVNIPMLTAGDGAEFARSAARKLTKPEVVAAAVIEQWQRDTHDVNELVTELGRQVEAVNGGDLRRAEGMLIAQAHSLDSIFAVLARRATSQEYLKQWEAYMRMAMKAQNQCRMTLETLATIKNPPAVFARQANINNGGQQQVNNGMPVTSTRTGAPAQETQSAPNELSEGSHELLQDTGASQAPSGTHPHMEPVEEIYRSA
jgi:hypothetical protein